MNLLATIFFASTIVSVLVLVGMIIYDYNFTYNENEMHWIERHEIGFKLVGLLFMGSTLAFCISLWS